MVMNEVATMAEQGMSAFETDDNLMLTENAFPANIKLMETLLASRPDHYPLLTLLAKMYGSYGFVYFEPRLEAGTLKVDYPGCAVNLSGKETVKQIKDALNRCYLKGAEYALKALETKYENCREQLNNVADTERFLAALNEEDVPPLFWYAFNLGGYVNQNLNSVKAISKAYLAEKAMLRCDRIESRLFYGSAHLFLMAYYGSRSPMMGGIPRPLRCIMKN